MGRYGADLTFLRPFPTSKGSDAAAGTQAAPFATVGKAVAATRELNRIMHGSGGTILLRAGVHYLAETVALDTRDAGLTIQNFEGEPAWLSGGVPLKTAWTKWSNGSTPKPPVRHFPAQFPPF